MDSTAKSIWTRGNVPLELVIDFPVVSSADKIVETDAEGSFCFRIANAPETTGVAKDVPLPVPVLPPGTDDTTNSPGAKRSRKEALSVNEDTSSESLVEPTLIALDTHPGASKAFTYPSFPDATTGAIPTNCNVSNSDS